MTKESQGSGNTNKNSSGHMRLADRVKKLRDGVRMHLYSEYSEEKGDKVEVAEVEHEGKVVGRYVKKGDTVVETHGSHDAQDSGLHVEAAKAAGIGADNITHTVASQAAHQAAEAGGEWGEGPQDIGSLGDHQADTPGGKPEENVEGDLTPGKSKEVKPKDAKDGKKPDSSMSKLATIKSGETDLKKTTQVTRDDAILLDPAHPKHQQLKAFYEKHLSGSSHHMAAAITHAPKYSKQWLQNQDKAGGNPDLTKSQNPGIRGWKAMFAAARLEHLSKAPQEPKSNMHPALSAHPDPSKRANAAAEAAVRTPRSSRVSVSMSMNKADGDNDSPGVKMLRAQLKKPHKNRPGSTDDKISEALDRQGKAGSPYASKRDDSTHTGTHQKLPEHVTNPRGPDRDAKRAARTEADDRQRAQDRSSERHGGKPVFLKEMKRYKQHTASGRPFQVMLGTDEAHRSLAGAHHVLEKPMTVQEVHGELRKPTSPLSRRVLDSVDGGHDTLYIHQPKSQAGASHGTLKVVKSELAKSSVTRSGYPRRSRQSNLFAAVRQMVARQKMQKNEEMGYPEGSPDPMAMSKAEPAVPKTHAEHAEAAAQDVRQMLHEKRTQKAGTEKPAHNEKIRALADGYAKTKGISLTHGAPMAEIDPQHSSKIAQAFEAMPHAPNDPKVKNAYGALINETMDQFNHIKNSGLKISKIQPGMENPYKAGSKDLFHDINNNNHLWYYPTESGFGDGQTSDHPLLAPTKEMIDGKPLLANDAFRIVHDVFGHAKEGHGFGPRGEESAWRTHMPMYSPEAQKALTSETRGQNSWVNFGPHGEHNRQNPGNTKYAEQKAGILPDWTMEHSKKVP